MLSKWGQSKYILKILNTHVLYLVDLPILSLTKAFIKIKTNFLNDLESLPTFPLVANCLGAPPHMEEENAKKLLLWLAI